MNVIIDIFCDILVILIGHDLYGVFSSTYGTVLSVILTLASIIFLLFIGTFIVLYRAGINMSAFILKPQKEQDKLSLEIGKGGIKTMFVFWLIIYIIIRLIVTP